MDQHEPTVARWHHTSVVAADPRVAVTILGVASALSAGCDFEEERVLLTCHTPQQSRNRPWSDCPWPCAVMGPCSQLISTSSRSSVSPEVAPLTQSSLREVDHKQATRRLNVSASASSLTYAAISTAPLDESWTTTGTTAQQQLAASSFTLPSYWGDESKPLHSHRRMAQL